MISIGKLNMPKNINRAIERLDFCPQASYPLLFYYNDCKDY
jgi:hypothetical protein